MTSQHHFTESAGGLLGLANLQRLRANPFAFLMGLAQTQGGIARFKFGPIANMVLVTEPEYIREILVKQWAKTIKWERLTRASNRVTQFNIVFLEGDSWRSQRKLLTPAFHSERVHAYIGLIQRHTHRLTEHWQPGQVLDIRDAMTRLTMGIIGEILFGIPDIEREAAPLSRAIDTLLAQFVTDASSVFSLPNWIPSERLKRVQEARQTIVTYLNRLIAERRAAGEDQGDVLSALLLARDADTGAMLTDDQVRDELYSLFVAGHETTALWMCWALHLLARHPEVQQQLHSSLRDHPGDETLLDAVLKETLRMYPPAWSLFMRRVIEDIQLGDQVISRSSVIYISPYVQHHLPRYWEDPERFDPSRFAGDWRSRLPAYVYMPFGGGPRVCLGSNLAEAEAKVILPAILEGFEVSLPDPIEEVHKDGGFTLRPYPHLKLRVERRRSLHA